MHTLQLDQPNMFFSRDELIAEAYRLQAKDMAYRGEDLNFLANQPRT